MTLIALARWIDQHDRPRPTKITDKGTLIIYTWAFGPGGCWAIEEDEVTNLAGARAVLGY